MNINTFILDQVSDCLYEYTTYFRDDFSFIEQGLTYEERQKHSTELIEKVMKVNDKKVLYKYIAELAKIEMHTKSLSSWQRDHVYHAILTYILGIFINEKFVDQTSHNKIQPFQWKLTGLFHDIGYPVQIANNLLAKVSKNVNNIDRNIFLSRKDLIQNMIENKNFFYVKTVDLEYLTDNFNSLALIQQCIKDWGLKDIEVRKEYELLQSGQRVCHGVLSSLLLLHVIDVMYHVWNPKREYKPIYGDTEDTWNINWDQTNFEREVVPACAAIFLHNLPEDRFAKNKIDPKKAILPFLLKLCDTLQEWERPSEENISGFSPLDFKISINGDILKFSAKDPKISEKVIKDLRNTIMLDSIEITSDW